MAAADQSVFPVPPDFAAQTLVTADRFKADYERSVRDPEGYWGEQGRRLTWTKPYTKVRDVNLTGDVRIRWFYDGELNVAANCLDRHLAVRGDQPALIWEPDRPDEPGRTLTYRQLHSEVCRFANVLTSRGVKKGDRVTLYLPMIPETAVAMLACARIGAIHSIVFAGFSTEALADRIQDAGSVLVITGDYSMRGGKQVPLKATVDGALGCCPTVRAVLVVKRTGGKIAWKDGRDFWYSDEMAKVRDQCAASSHNAEDPLFILYTSGSTGKPKGAVHTMGGYLLYAAMTHELAFDYKPGEVYWCTADVGWVTGHSYIVYGPLANGATSLMFEGVPTFPDASRCWQVIDKHRVNIFYTAPTLIRSLMREGDKWLSTTTRQSLRVLGSVGEPINPEAWLWFHRAVGGGRCPIVDTWWQTETGGFMIMPLPGAVPLKPGSAGFPFFGVQLALVDAEGKELQGEAEGALVVLNSWPGQMRTIWGDAKRYASGYFEMYPGKYFTGDGARRDRDGYYWITGRVDDVINVSGHRLGTAEVESALVATGKVAEAAVVGYPHSLKGQGIYAYVTLKTGFEPSEGLKKDLVAGVRKTLGPIATPDVIQWAPGLPKTRSGKIMRRILRKIAAGEDNELGDTSTLADPGVVGDLVAGAKKGKPSAKL